MGHVVGVWGVDPAQTRLQVRHNWVVGPPAWCPEAPGLLGANVDFLGALVLWRPRPVRALRWGPSRAWAWGWAAGPGPVAARGQDR